MVYKYDDEFITNEIDTNTIENIESQKYEFVLNKLNISDTYYLEKLTKTLVYMDLAKMQLESDGMKAKYDVYKAEYGHYLKLAKSNGGVFNIKLKRG